MECVLFIVQWEWFLLAKGNFVVNSFGENVSAIMWRRWNFDYLSHNRVSQQLMINVTTYKHTHTHNGRSQWDQINCCWIINRKSQRKSPPPQKKHYNLIYFCYSAFENYFHNCCTKAHTFSCYEQQMPVCFMCVADEQTYKHTDIINERNQQSLLWLIINGLCCFPFSSAFIPKTKWLG